MEVKETIGLSGRFIFEVRDPFGRIKETRDVSNLITNAGKLAVAGRIAADITQTGFDYLAVGTGTSTANSTETALVAEVMRIGTAAVVGTLVTSNVSSDTAQLVGTFSPAASYALTEVGVLNAASGGSLLARTVYSVINVTSGDAVSLTYKVTVA